MTDPLQATFTATDLMAQEFPPIEYVVPGLIPQGLSLLVAAPKIGKSWMVLGLAVSAASGTRAFGAIPTNQRPVLYLALEDGPQRLQARLKSLGVTDAPQALHFAVTLTTDVRDTVAAFLEAHNTAKPLVILDTLGKVMPLQMQNESAYQRDYRVGTYLKQAVDAVPGAALIVVHHTRKVLADDFVESSSGTNGLTGAADTILMLRRDRNAQDASLHVTSRDAKEGEYSLHLDDFGRWTLAGTSLQEASRAAVTHQAASGLGDLSADIVRALADHPTGIRAPELAIELAADERKTATYLLRLHNANRIQRLSRGLYAPLPIPPVESVESVETGDTNSTFLHIQRTPRSTP